MEVHELQEWMKERLDTQDKLLDAKLKPVADCITKMDARVNQHDRMLSMIKGIGSVAVIALGYMGIKIHIN